MCEHCMNRRQFATVAGAGLGAGVLGLSSVVAAEGPLEASWDPDKPPHVTGRPLRVQPILAHGVAVRREKTSWRSWSAINDEPAAAEEMHRIADELNLLKAKAEFPLEILPTVKVTTVEQAANVQKGDFDVVLLYAASNGTLFRPCARPIPAATRSCSCATSPVPPITATSVWARDFSRFRRPSSGRPTAPTTTGAPRSTTWWSTTTRRSSGGFGPCTV